jgi:hypothetical protein
MFLASGFLLSPQDPEAQAFGEVKKLPSRHFMTRLFRKLRLHAAKFKNISIDKDPEMAVPLRVMIPVTVTCVFYIGCRCFLYFEDFSHCGLSLLACITL